MWCWLKHRYTSWVLLPEGEFIGYHYFHRKCRKCGKEQLTFRSF